MADTHGQTPDPLIAELVKRPYAFDFFHAVRLLESHHPELPRIGFSLSPGEDTVRFWQNPSLRFPPSTIESFQPGTPEAAPRMAVYFFGLFGTHGPLPPHLTEYVLEREIHHHDHTITAFLNIFHHRLISLFYRAWAASQKAVDLDRPAGQRYATYLGSLFGIGMEALRERDAVPDAAKLFFTGRLSNQTRNQEGLEAILREYFHIPAQVEQFVGRWLHLPADSLCQLSHSMDSGSLGLNTILGTRFWDSQLSFRMRFGPMSLADYIRLLPPDPNEPSSPAIGHAGNGPETGRDGDSGSASGSSPGFGSASGAAPSAYDNSALSSRDAGDPSAFGSGSDAAALGSDASFGHTGSPGASGLSDFDAGADHAKFDDAGPDRPNADRPNAGMTGSAAAGGQGGDSGGFETSGAGPAGVGGQSSGSSTGTHPSAPYVHASSGGDPQLADFFRAQAAGPASGPRSAAGAVAASGTRPALGRNPSPSTGGPSPRGAASAFANVRRGESFERVKYWVKNYCGEHFFWDAQLVLRAEEVPETCLGHAGWLGYTTWLKTKPFSSDADELILNPPPD